MSESKKRRAVGEAVQVTPPTSPKSKDDKKGDKKKAGATGIHSPEPRAPPAIAAAPAPSSSDYEKLARYIDEQLTLAKDRIDMARDDHQKLKDVVEDRFTHQQILRNDMDMVKTELNKPKPDKAKHVTHADLHMSTGRIMEECEKLIKQSQKPMKEFGEQVREAISQTNGLQLSMDTFVSGAFNIVEENLKILEKEILDFKNSYAPKSSLKQLEELVSALGRTAPPTDGLPSAGDANKHVSFLLREFGSLKADIQLIENKLEQGNGKTIDKDSKDVCHCKHLDELKIIVEQMQKDLERLQQASRFLHERNGETPPMRQPPGMYHPHGESSERQTGGQRQDPNAMDTDYPMWSFFRRHQLFQIV